MAKVEKLSSKSVRITELDALSDAMEREYKAAFVGEMRRSTRGVAPRAYKTISADIKAQKR